MQKKYVGNSGSATNSVRNLQKKLNREKNLENKKYTGETNEEALVL